MVHIHPNQPNTMTLCMLCTVCAKHSFNMLLQSGGETFNKYTVTLYNIGTLVTHFLLNGILTATHKVNSPITH